MPRLLLAPERPISCGAPASAVLHAGGTHVRLGNACQSRHPEDTQRFFARHRPVAVSATAASAPLEGVAIMPAAPAAAHDTDRVDPARFWAVVGKWLSTNTGSATKSAVIGGLCGYALNFA